MGNNTLNDLMHVIMHAPSIEEFDTQNAMDTWYRETVRKRRPEQAPYRKKKYHDFQTVT